MKLVLQIAVGVFLGSLASQLAFDGWHTYQKNKTQKATEKIRAEQERVRKELNERIRALLLQGRQGNDSMLQRPPANFVPDDAQGQPIERK